MSPLTGLPGCLVAWLPFDCDSFELARSTLVSHGGGDGAGTGAGAGEPPPGHTLLHSIQAQLQAAPTLIKIATFVAPHWLALALASASAFASALAFACACASTRLDATRCGLAWLGLFGLHSSWEISLMEIITFDYFSN